MAKVKIKITRDDIEQSKKDSGDFVVPKPGIYILTLKECNPGFSKDENGNEDSKRPRLECIYEVTGIGREDREVTENYGNIWDYVSFSPKSGFRRVQFAKAVGILPVDADDSAEVELETDDAVGQRVLARLRTEKGRTKEDAPRAKVAALYNLSETAADEADALSNLPSQDEPELDFSGGEDSEGEDEGEDEVTEDELLKMDLKELGELAKANDIVPQDHIVKTRGKLDNAKTKAALIAAILDAGSGAEEEDPF